jgi:hypothetical protein
MSKSGYSSRDLGELAEDTFSNLLKYWFGQNATNSCLSPDWQGVDLRTQIGSSRSKLETLHINWQIKSRSVEPKKSKIYGERAFRISIKKSEYNSIISACGSEDYFYLVLAKPNASLDELYRLNDIEKFSLYAVDVKQYVRAIKRKDKTTKFSSIFIPESNKLNLATMSLLWGSLWMDKMLGGLSKSIHYVSSDLWRYLTTSPYVDSVSRSDIQKGRKYYNEVRGNIDPLVSSNLNLIVGNVLSIAQLDYVLGGKRPSAYQSMTQEFLGDEVNLWLFFTPFRYYVLKNNRDYSVSDMVRIFPSPKIDTLSLIQRCAIFHVVMWHKLAGIYCECVTNDIDNTGDITSVPLKSQKK